MVEEPLAYARIPALGNASRVGLGLAERAGEGLQGFEEVYLVIEGDGAGRAAKIVREIAKLPSEDEGFVIGEEEGGVEELSLVPTAIGSREESFAPDDEDADDEDADDEDADDEDADDEDADDEDADDEDADDEDADDEDADDEDADDEDVAPEDDKPKVIDDSDLPWAPGAKKGRRSR
jgi:hypothetical protein